MSQEVADMFRVSPIKNFADVENNIQLGIAQVPGDIFMAAKAINADVRVAYASGNEWEGFKNKMADVLGAKPSEIEGVSAIPYGSTLIMNPNTRNEEQKQLLAEFAVARILSQAGRLPVPNIKESSLPQANDPSIYEKISFTGNMPEMAIQMTENVLYFSKHPDQLIKALRASQ